MAGALLAQNKTQQTDQSVAEFLASFPHEKRRDDAMCVADMMRDVTGVDPRMWGKALIGFDSYHYKYDSGREGDWFRVGLSPRKTSLSVYIMPGFERYTALLGRLGKYKTGVSCLYINKLEDIDFEVLKELVSQSYKDMQTIYPA